MIDLSHGSIGSNYKKAKKWQWLNTTVLWLLIILPQISILSNPSSFGIHVPLLIIFGTAILFKNPELGRNKLVFIFFILSFVFYFVLNNLLSPCQDLIAKSLTSLVALLLVIISLAYIVHRSTPVDISKTLRWIVFFVVTSVIIEKFYLVLTGASPLIRPGGIYSEPSHLALSLSPALAALIESPELRNKLWGWVSAALLFIVSASSTLFITFGLCLFFTTLSRYKNGTKSKFWNIRSFASTGLVVLLVFTSPYKEDFFQRIEGLNEVSVETNISSLAYLNGWLTASHNIDNSYWMGLGFNRMGCNPRPTTKVDEILVLFELEDLNYNDGSFMASKIISELGIFGIVMYIIVFFSLFLVIFKRRNTIPDKELTTLHAFIISSLVVFTIGSFIRGTSYFSGAFMIGIWAWFQIQKHELWSKS